MPDALTDFQRAIVKAVDLVPEGKVVSYGQIAAYIGSPRAARQVGWAMASIGEVPGLSFPWWRVVNKDGVITINNQQITPQTQKELLETEAVEVSDKFQIDMRNYGYDLLSEAPPIDAEGQQRLRLTGDKFFG
jgi:methylated-DNA-protein-cysteine methyltransferase-like protein